MKRNLLYLLVVFSTAFVNAQNGLRNIIIEKYYISNAADSTAASDDQAGAGNQTGTLPAGSVTYRIYANLLPGYKFEATYGVNGSGDVHPCIFSTSTFFYNNSNGGAAPAWSKGLAKNNTQI